MPQTSIIRGRPLQGPSRVAVGASPRTRKQRQRSPGRGDINQRAGAVRHLARTHQPVPERFAERKVTIRCRPFRGWFEICDSVPGADATRLHDIAPTGAERARPPHCGELRETIDCPTQNLRPRKCRRDCSLLVAARAAPRPSAPQRTLR